ncbi:hypothetical protein AC629_08265 [Bradyrhizobium sp. NAS80.1]|nr:hypothetical protein AC629_08265 [Bradyrhizobium sp. NAS80.1]
MPHAQESGKRRCEDDAKSAKVFSAKRNGGGKVFPHRHCERSEAIQNLFAEAVWIASRSQSSGRAARGPLARNDGV